ncbi:putative colanic acid biosynthesis acetyltransferase [Rhodopirellula halodulae]|uniref:putative colanic acid biosynthesis acetyltransferase n=1 Tax=Rhodopirellula halodulae TaxID=2894198 RepID=UPI001E4F3625|nr:putative colanic acid biosynthesis acetyltransferase [Rhodopirellula sp. JC737]
MLWTVAWKLLASWTPPPLRYYRVAIVRLFGGDIAWDANIYGNARIWLPSNLRMESRSCLGPRSNCYCMGKITLREGAIVSQDASLCAASHDVGDQHFQLTVAPIEIGRGAWVAAEAFIGPGVTVANGAVVGARACLFKDADANGIYVGNPAREIRKRRLQKAGRSTS